MKYPVQKIDLKNNIASDDEQATMIVVEAILSNTFDSLEFKEQSRGQAIRESVINWEKFNDFSSTISSQKSLLNRVIGSSEQRLDSRDQALSDAIAIQVFESSKQEMKKNKRTKVMGALSVAAGLAIIAIGITSALSSLNTGTKSSSTRVASVQTTTSPTQEKSSSADSADSVDGIDPESNEIKSNSDSPTVLSVTPGYSDNGKDATNKSSGGSITNRAADNSPQNTSSEAQSDWYLSKIVMVCGIGIVALATLVLGLIFVKRHRKNV